MLSSLNTHWKLVACRSPRHQQSSTAPHYLCAVPGLSSSVKPSCPCRRGDATQRQKHPHGALALQKVVPGSRQVCRQVRRFSSSEGGIARCASITAFSLLPPMFVGRPESELTIIVSLSDSTRTGPWARYRAGYSPTPFNSILNSPGTLKRYPKP